MIIETLQSKLDQIKSPDFEKKSPLATEAPTEYGNFVYSKITVDRQPSPSLGLHVTIDSDQYN